MSNDWIYSAIIGAGVPLLVALFTKARATVATKAWLGNILATIGAIAVGLQSDDTDWRTLASNVIAAVLALQASYRQVWKPTAIVGPPEQPGKLDAATQGFGLGRTA